MRTPDYALLHHLLESFKRARRDFDNDVPLEEIDRNLKKLASTAELLQRRLEVSDGRPFAMANRYKRENAA